MSDRIVTARCKTCGALAKAWFFPDEADAVADIAGVKSEDRFAVADEYGGITGPIISHSECPDCIRAMEESRS